MQVTWSAIGTPAHEGTKIYRMMTAQRAQLKVTAEGLQAAG